MSEFLDSTFTTFNAKTFKYRDYFTLKDFVLDGNRPFIKFFPMLRVARELFDITSYKCTVNQSPTPENGMSSVCVAEYTFSDGKKTWVWSGAADCGDHNPASVSDRYPTAMAETRAKARALRDALGIEFCSSDEISNKKGFSPADTDPFETAGKSSGGGINAGQRIAIDKLMGQKSVSVDTIGDMVERQIKNISELTNEEAAKVLQKLNSKKG